MGPPLTRPERGEGEGEGVGKAYEGCMRTASSIKGLPWGVCDEVCER